MTLTGGGTGRVPNRGDSPDLTTDEFALQGVVLDLPRLQKLVNTITKGFPPTGVRFTSCVGRRRRKNPTRTTLDALIAAVRQDNSFGRTDRLDCLIIEARAIGKDTRMITVELREFQVLVTAEAVDEEWISGRFDLVRKQLKAAQRRMPVLATRALIQCPIGAIAGLGTGLGLTLGGRSPLGMAMASAASSVVGTMVGLFSARRARTVIEVESKPHGRGVHHPSFIQWVGIAISAISVVVAATGVVLNYYTKTSTHSSSSLSK
jgi:hypothetical protein